MEKQVIHGNNQKQDSSSSNCSCTETTLCSFDRLMNILSVVRDPISYMKKLRGCPPGVTFNAAIKFLLLVMTMKTWNFQKRTTPKPIDISKDYYFLLFTQTMLKKHCDLSQFLPSL